MEPLPKAPKGMTAEQKIVWELGAQRYKHQKAEIDEEAEMEQEMACLKDVLKEIGLEKQIELLGDYDDYTFSPVAKSPKRRAEVLVDFLNEIRANTTGRFSNLSVTDLSEFYVDVAINRVGKRRRRITTLIQF